MISSPPRKCRICESSSFLIPCSDEKYCCPLHYLSTSSSRCGSDVIFDGSIAGYVAKDDGDGQSLQKIFSKAYIESRDELMKLAAEKGRDGDGGRGTVGNDIFGTGRKFRVQRKKQRIAVKVKDGNGGGRAPGGGTVASSGTVANNPYKRIRSTPRNLWQVSKDDSAAPLSSSSSLKELTMQATCQSCNNRQGNNYTDRGVKSEIWGRKDDSIDEGDEVVCEDCGGLWRRAS